MDKRSIGLIDSGIGGFTVLKELQNSLNNEDFLYFGDSKNMPYGEKSNEEIINLVNSDIAYLEEQNVKAIVLACNTASSLIDQLSSNVPLFSIIDAGCLAVVDVGEPKLGLIATRATVNNKAYDNIIKNYTDDIRFISFGTPTLAQVINNQLDEIELLKKNIHLAIEPILSEYPIKYLLLGCTHFPIVSETIKSLYPNIIQIDPAKKEAEILSDFLTKNDLSNDKNNISETKIFITGEDNRKMSLKLLEELEIDYKNLEIIN